MKGLAFTASVSTQAVVARKNSALRRSPSGMKAHNNVDHAASTSSAQMPADAMARRCCERASFQLSPVSV
ncbi:hypothetical protein D9M72_540780 [compost metagenome]